MKQFFLMIFLVIASYSMLQAQQIENNTPCTVRVGITCYSPGSCIPTTVTAVVVAPNTVSPYTLCPGGRIFTAINVAFDPPCKNGSLDIASPGNCMGLPSSGILNQLAGCNCVSGGSANAFFATSVNVRINP